MKKLLFLLLLLPAICSAQDWGLYSARSPYRAVTNGDPWLGQSAGTISAPLQWDASVSAPDTSIWRFVAGGSAGQYRLLTNRSTYMSREAGTVFLQLVYGANASTSFSPSVDNNFTSPQTFNGITNNGAINSDTLKQGGYPVKPYKTYVSLVSQVGTDAPFDSVLENTMGNPVWTREEEGIYQLKFSGVTINQNKLVCLFGSGEGGTGQDLQLEYHSSNSLWLIISTLNVDFAEETFAYTPSDGVLLRVPIEIRLYP